MNLEEKKTGTWLEMFTWRTLGKSVISELQWNWCICYTVWSKLNLGQNYFSIIFLFLLTLINHNQWLSTCRFKRQRNLILTCNINMYVYCDLLCLNSFKGNSDLDGLWISVLNEHTYIFLQFYLSFPLRFSFNRDVSNTQCLSTLPNTVKFFKNTASYVGFSILFSNTVLCVWYITSIMFWKKKN